VFGLGCGHWIQQEKTEETNKLILDLLKQHQGCEIESLRT